MYIVNITLNNDHLNQKEQDEMLTEHRAWFAKYFETGDFLLLGPYLDKANAGIIIIKDMDKESLTNILAEDVYYPNLAEYDIRTFKAAKVSTDISAE